jgi:endoglucanase
MLKSLVGGLLWCGLNSSIGFSEVPNYAEALQKSLFFYDSQRSGVLPKDFRVSWRGDSAVGDGLDEGIDLTGGWYDAGDHVKFGFPAASTATLLAWSLIENRSAYKTHGQELFALENLKWINDFFIKAHPTRHVLWGQVGEGGADHGFWGPAEVMPMVRKSFKIDPSCPGSDLAGETAASMAAAALVFKENDQEYSKQLIRHSEELYEFADRFRGLYSDCIRDAGGYYRSTGYQDELIWGALWLYQATGKTSYLTKAESMFDQLKQNGEYPYKWTHAWDDKTYGSYILMDQITGNPKYRAAAEKWLDYWTVGVPEGRVRYTPGGLAWLDMWGSLRYSANTSMLALIYSKYLKDKEPTQAARYWSFGKSQIDYMLGNNPAHTSYVIGMGDRFPQNPHHRGAHGSWSNNIGLPAKNRHILYGALVGGPDLEDRYQDDRSDYVKNEVALDYNGGFQGALAALADVYGGHIEERFPAPEVKDEEFFSTARINVEGDNFVEIALKIHNHSAWPARSSPKLFARYFFSLSEIPDHQDVFGKIKVTTNYNQGVQISEVKLYDKTRSIYYVEADFSQAAVKPIGEGDSQKEIQFRLAFPNELGKWKIENDWSFQELVGFEFRKSEKIPVFSEGEQVWGKLP